MPTFAIKKRAKVGELPLNDYVLFGRNFFPFIFLSIQSNGRLRSRSENRPKGKYRVRPASVPVEREHTSVRRVAEGGAGAAAAHEPRVAGVDKVRNITVPPIYFTSSIT